MSYLSSLNFSGRRVLVTGGAKGIGLAITKRCVELNADVFVIGRDEQALKELTTKFPSVTVLKVDLSDWDATRKAVESILPIHHLANNAGCSVPRPFFEIDLENINTNFAVNFNAALNVGQVVAKGMIEHGIKNGTIVNLSSVPVSQPGTNLLLPIASKEGISVLTKSMAVELGPHGITVNSIRPGFTMTQTTEDFTNENQITGDIWLEYIRQRTLTHKWIEPEKIANAFIFLSSPLSSAISGTDLTIDDGFSIL